MKYWKRFLLLTIIIVACLSFLLLLRPEEQVIFCSRADDGAYVLYRMDDEMNLTEIRQHQNNPIAWENDMAAWVDYEGKLQRLMLMDMETRETRCIYEADGSEETWLPQRIQIVNNKVYISSVQSETDDIVVVEYAPDGSRRILTECTPFGIFLATDDSIYYLSEENLPMKYSLVSGDTVCLSQQEAQNFWSFIYVEDGRLWYTAQAENGLDAVLVGADGQDVLEFSYRTYPDSDVNFWLWHGKLYYFVNPVEKISEDGTIETYGDLCCMDVKTGEETILISQLSYHKAFPPSLVFSNQGIIIIYDRSMTARDQFPEAYFVNNKNHEIINLEFPKD